MGILLAILLACAMAPLCARAQHQYNISQGYTCNGRDKTCNTYAFYRTFQEQESLAKVASYFRITPASLADVSGVKNLAPNASLPKGQALYIPLNCSCFRNYEVIEVTSQMQVPYTVQAGDTLYQVAMTIYGGLTTFQAMMDWNPTIARNIDMLTIGDTIMVPIFCACPTVEEIANGTTFLVTYTVYPNETLHVISNHFNIISAQLGAANQLAVNASLKAATTILVPLEKLPPIATMNFLPIIIRPTSNSSQRRKVGIIVGLSIGVVGVLLVASLFIAKYQRRTSSKKQDKLGDFSLVGQNLLPRMFTSKELKKVTKNFRRSELLGSGGFGAVYKGTLPSGELVAVKRMQMVNKHGKESFQAEVTSLSQIRHRNLVELRGWCHEEEQLLLVYDYMCNGNLHEWLFHFSKCFEKGYGKELSSLRDDNALPLKLRHSILSGVANALSYLHEDCAQCVLHRDIKSNNVLLDGKLNAYLGDFGLARLIDHQKVARTTMMAGTWGYLAPEMIHTGKATKESDVYSFGILMLEVMSGMHPLDVSAIDQGEGLLEDKVWQAHEAGNILQVADSRLGTFSFSNAHSSSFGGPESPNQASSILVHNDMVDVDPSTMYTSLDGGMEDKKMITNLLQLGLLCCNPSPEDRPSMRLVSQLMLQPAEDMEMSMPCLPKQKPQVHYSRV